MLFNLYFYTPLTLKSSLPDEIELTPTTTVNSGFPDRPKSNGFLENYEQSQIGKIRPRR